MVIGPEDDIVTHPGELQIAAPVLKITPESSGMTIQRIEFVILSSDKKIIASDRWCRPKTEGVLAESPNLTAGIFSIKTEHMGRLVFTGYVHVPIGQNWRCIGIVQCTRAPFLGA